MTTHAALQITLGPVQDFIEQARRTRDLWFGSHLLSELSRAAARALVRGEATLIFPPFQFGDAELVSCPTLLRPGTEEAPRAVGNVLLATVADAAKAEALARAVREAVADNWRKTADGVRQRCTGLIAPEVNDALWNDQIDGFLEFAAAWTVYQGDAEFRDARDRLARAIGGRKNLRDFVPWRHQRAKAPRSSLDGGRQSVLREPKDRSPDLVRRYRISEGEQLDAVGLVKRAGGEPDQFVPIPNVALACWLARARERRPEQFKELETFCRDEGEALAPWRVRKTIPCGEPFGYCATLLLPSRWKSELKELGWKPDDERATKLQKRAEQAVGRKPEPFPYVACLVADGDRVGTVIDRLTTPKAHQELSKEMGAFAGAARQVIEQEHRGLLVYAGGDDVLAFLPVQTALAGADALRQRFAAIMDEACPDLPQAERPTLSVGLGIGHMLEGMADLLALGREAERLAKDGGGAGDEAWDEAGGAERNALAIVLDKRSGGKRRWRRRWDHPDEGGRLEAARQRLVSGTVSGGKIFEVEAARRGFPKPAATDAEDPPVAALIADILHVLRHGDAGNQSLPAAAFGLWRQPPASYRAAYAAIGDWVDRMVIAKTLAEAENSLGEGETEQPKAGAEPS